MNFDKLTPEKRNFVEGKSPEELLDLAKSEGAELSDKDLESISGGWGVDENECPDGQHDLVLVGSYPTGSAVFNRYECTKCGYQELV